MPRIGFAILSHSEPQQLYRLVTTLNAMFGHPPVVCHHDFSKCSLDEAAFASNIRFVHPHFVTRWGHITLPLAALKALSVLRSHEQPDWFVLLSGSDYPVRPAKDILADLSSSAYDVYLDNRPILYRDIPPGQTAAAGFGRPEWIPKAYDRYCAFRVPVPLPSMKLLFSGTLPFQRKHIRIRHPDLIRLLQRNPPVRIFAGDFWFEANRNAVNRLLDDGSVSRLVRYFSRRPIPEESFIQTALCNQPDLRISSDNKRYEDWTNGGAHPKWLEASDVPKILLSGAHFARKFRPDGVAQTLLDQAVLDISD